MSPEHVALLARLELTRRYRSFFGDNRRVVVVALAGLFMLLPIGGVVVATYAFGSGIASGDLEAPMWVVRASGAGAVALVGFMAAIRAVQTTAVPVNADALLTTAGHREVVVSIFVAETLTTGALFGAPGLLAAIAFGAGAGSATAGIGFALAGVTTLLLGTAVGIAIGFAVRNAVARSEVLARYKTAIGLLLLVAYFFALTSGPDGGSGSTLGAAAAALGRTPLGWFGDLALAGTPVGGTASLAAGATGLTVIGVLSSVLITERLAGRLWYEESVEVTPEEPESTGMGDFGGVSRPVGRVARKCWLRAWRSPVRLLYVAYPLFGVLGPISEAVREGVIPPYLPVLVALYGAWATGAAFTLNPIGDETDVLPVTLTTPIGGRQFMTGCCLAGVALGAPLTALVVVGLALAAGTSWATTASAAALGVSLPIGATALATGIGTTFPRLEAVNVTRGRKAVVPSLFGFAIYSVVLSLLAAPGLAVTLPGLRGSIAGATGLASAIVPGVGATLLLLGVVGFGSFRHAVRSFDRYYLE